MLKSDVQIQEAVIEELAWDSRVATDVIWVTVGGGVVTLRGTVTSLGKRLAAEDAAHRVAGVHDVANEIVVTIPEEPRYDDTAIAGAIRQTLQWDVFVPADRIHTTVTNGFVTLYGTVETLAQRREVARVVGNIAGVCAIDNLISIAANPVASSNMRTAILEALERRAAREVDKVSLEVEGDRVTVSGPVHSWTEREAILGVARATRGVATVVDRLYITG